ncbi:MAG TPA: efflux RND transporter periplasmic adaptor subunit [Casimicrobiaceae bacterium]|nr:efflux RND transporter periplasmic adaptor subunit [Casimicrobiaceae bacterium]
MTTTSRSQTVKRALGALAVLGVIAFIVYGLYLANRPVVAPLQGQIDGRYIDISPKIVGRIATLHVREGDEVKPGDLLVTLDSPEVQAKLSQAEAARGAAAAKQNLVDNGVRQEEIRTARANWERAISAANLAETTYKRINALYKDGLVSEQRNDEVDTAYRSALDAVAAARAQYDLTVNGFRKEERLAAAEVTRGAGAGVQEVAALAADISLKSPISAEVDKVLLHQGELAPPGFPIISLVNLDDVWVVFNLREDELAQIKIDSRITGKLPALGDRMVTFSVYYISPKGEYATWRATRQSSGYDIKTFEVRARPTEKVIGLRPGMSVLVDRS